MAFPVVQETKTNVARNNAVIVSAFSGLAIGDLMIAVISVVSNTAPNIGAPSGWTQLHTYSPGTQMIFYMKIAVLSDVGSTFTFTWSTAGSNQDCGAASIVRITGADPTTPILSGTYNDGSGTASFVGTAINPAKNVLFLEAIGYTINTSQLPSTSGYSVANNNPSWTELADSAIVTATNSATAGVAVADANQGALGTTGTASATLSVASSSYTFGFLGIQAPPAIVTTIFGAKFGVPKVVVPVIVKIFGAKFGVLQATSNVIAATWSFLSKGSTLPGDWTDTSK